MWLSVRTILGRPGHQLEVTVWLNLRKLSLDNQLFQLEQQKDGIQYLFTLESVQHFVFLKLHLKYGLRKTKYVITEYDVIYCMYGIVYDGVS